MKTKNILIIIAIIIGIATLSLFMNKNEVVVVNDEISYNSPQADPADAKYPKGAKIYKEKCIICHMANEEGIKGAFPPLKNSDYLFANKVRAIAQTLNGSNEPMVVNGVTYVAPMTPQVSTKEDAVAVINYVLNAWGNNGGTISMDDVKNVKINPR